MDWRNNTYRREERYKRSAASGGSAKPTCALARFDLRTILSATRQPHYIHMLKLVNNHAFRLSVGEEYPLCYVHSKRPI